MDGSQIGVSCLSYGFATAVNIFFEVMVSICSVETNENRVDRMMLRLLHLPHLLLSLLCALAATAPIKTNITIGLISWYCLSPGAKVNGSFVTEFINESPSSFDATTFEGMAQLIDSQLELAIRDVNQDPSFLPGVHVNVKRFSDCGAWTPTIAASWAGSPGGFAASIMAASDIIEVHTDVIGVIGTEFSKTTKATAEVLSVGKIPYCSGAAGSPVLSDKNKYPYFFRTIPALGSGDHIFQLLKLWGVSRVAAVYDPSDALSSETHFDAFKSLINRGITVLDSVPVPDSTNANVLDYAARTLEKATARYVVIFGNSHFVGGVLYGLGQRGMVDSIHVYIGLNLPVPPNKLSGFSRYLRGYILLLPEQPGGASASQIQAEKELQSFTGYNFTDSDYQGVDNTGSYRDCLMVLLSGFDKILKQSGEYAAAASHLSERKFQDDMNFTNFKDLGIHGVTADPIQLSINGDVLLPYQAYFFTGENPSVSCLFGSTDIHATGFIKTRSPPFFSNTSTPPPDQPEPVTIYTYSHASPAGIMLLVFSCIGVGGTLIAVIILVVYRRDMEIRAMSLPEAITLCVGCTVVFCVFITYLDLPTVLKCKLKFVGFYFGYILILSSLLSKTMYLYIIYRLKGVRKAKQLIKMRRNVRLANVMLIFGEIMLSMIWWKYAGSKPFVSIKSTAPYYSCKDEAGILTDLFLLFSIGLLSLLCIMGYLTSSSLLEGQNESIALYMISLSTTIVVTLIQALKQNPDRNSDFIHCLLLGANCALILLWVIIRRILIFFQRWRHNFGVSQFETSSQGQSSHVSKSLSPNRSSLCASSYYATSRKPILCQRLVSVNIPC
ncbi:periplasmic binding protein-like I [Chytriomyces sp. MP71]|nr:periplasmic binding protein-like I [Chytriomyces sp. MP71]